MSATLKPALLLWVFLLGISGFVRSEKALPACESRADVVAACFTLHGRLSLGNGTPSARIWGAGTQRMLGIPDDALPEALAAQLSDFNTELWGDFKVCPLTRAQPGQMQSVCVASWRNLRVHQRK